MTKYISYFLIVFIVCLLSMFFENTLIALPIGFFSSVLLLNYYRNAGNYAVILLFGLIIDSFHVEYFGITPLFAFGTYFLLLLYEQYIGKSDILIVLGVTVIVGFIYLLVLSYTMTPFVVFILSMIGVMVLINFLKKKNKSRIAPW